jgi:hypothetical protein
MYFCIAIILKNLPKNRKSPKFFWVLAQTGYFAYGVMTSAKLCDELREASNDYGKNACLQTCTTGCADPDDALRTACSCTCCKSTLESHAGTCTRSGGTDAHAPSLSYSSRVFALPSPNVAFTSPPLLSCLQMLSGLRAQACILLTRQKRLDSGKARWKPHGTNLWGFCMNWSK